MAKGWYVVHTYSGYENKVEKHIQQSSAGVYVVDGKTPVKEINERLGLELSTEDATTINGLLLLLFDRVPSAKDFIHHRGLLFTVIEVDVQENRIMKVEINRGTGL